MKEFDINIEESRFVCSVFESDRAVEICGYRGNSANISLPNQVEKDGIIYEVRGIGKKAFLGNRNLRSVVLPENVAWIGDWAFAQCEQLKGFAASGEHVEFGIGVFMDCRQIEYIAVGGDVTDSQAVLLGTTVERMPSEDLLRDAEIGTEHWYRKWDQRLQTFLAEPDDDGYTNMVLCGEEDIQRNEQEFASDKRRRKAGLCMCRLQNDTCLMEDARTLYLDYLHAHTKGCESEEAWDYVVMEHGDALEYYRQFAELGCVTRENIDAMIQDLDAQNAEAKAFLIQYKQEHFAVENVFDLFSL